MVLAVPQQRDSGIDRHDQSPVDARLAGLCNVWSFLPEHRMVQEAVVSRKDYTRTELAYHIEEAWIGLDQEVEVVFEE
jgi:hypothetical protein